MFKTFKNCKILFAVLLASANLFAQEDPFAIIENSLRALGGKKEIAQIRNIKAFADCTGPNGQYTTETEAREAVRKSKADGYDFIKVTTNLKPEVYEAIVDETRLREIRVIGHADSRFVGLARAFRAGQQIEHLDSYLEALLPADAPVKGSVSDIYLYNPKNWESIDYLDESKIPELAKLTVQSNPFVTPTLHLFKFTFGKGRSEASFMAQPDIRFYPQKTIDFWTGISKKYLATAAPIEKREKYIAIRNKIVKAVFDAGGRLMAGSDTPEWLILYGFSSISK